MFARAQFKHLPDQHEDGDDGCGFEVDGHRAIMRTQRGWKNVRQESRDDAVSPSDAGADGDEREHVEIARLDRLPSSLEEWPARPQHDRRREGKLQQVGCSRVDQMVQPEEMAAHLQNENGRGEHEADPEAARHVREFRIGSGVGGDDVGLERHATNRARTRSDLPDLGVHRAGVNRAFRYGLGGSLSGTEILRRVGDEFRAAPGAAEIVRVPGVLCAMLGGVRIDVHSADRIFIQVLGLWFGCGRLEIFLRIGGEFRAATGAAEIVRASVMLGAMLGSQRIDVHSTYGVFVQMLGLMLCLRWRGVVTAAAATFAVLCFARVSVRFVLIRRHSKFRMSYTP